MQELLHQIVPGAMVEARGERWQVRQARPLSPCAIVTLEGADTGNQRQRTTLLLPFDRIEPIAHRVPARRRRDAVTRGIVHAILTARPARGLWCAAAARMELLAWQLAPALAVLDGATRLLLADAVGLGKTVQAGLVLAELRARGHADRALVLAPAAVRVQWAEELGRRLDLPVTVLDLPTLLELERVGPVGVNPWGRAPVVVSSIDLVKRPEVRASVEDVPFDVLVVDEAHHLTPGTDRHAVVSRLAREVPWVVMASATPHSGDAAAYRALLAIGAVPDAPDSMRVFRRTHRQVQLGVSRRTSVLLVRPTPEEAALHRGVLAYARDLCRNSTARSPGAHLLASLLARRATSSPSAARLTLARRLDVLSGLGHVATDTPPLPWEEFDADDGREPWIAAGGLQDVAGERARLQELIACAEAAAAHASKIVRLQRLLERVREPVIVFSEFRDTVEACAAALEAVTPVVCLHGGLDASERQRRLASFLDGPARVLLTTDVAGEGLNLQAHSRIVVTVEWPWNPLRLEQRIGRVHRLGQSRTVHACHLTARDSYEETVVARVLQRAARASDAMARVTDGTDRAVAAEVLCLPADARDDSRQAAHEVASGALESLASAEARRLARARGWLALGRPLGGQGVWTTPTHARRSPHVVAVVEVALHSAGGGLRVSHVVPVAVTLSEVPPHRRAWRVVCRRLASDERIRQAAVAAQPEDVGGDWWAPVRARLDGMRRLRRSSRPRAVQPSLFDRRALCEVERDDAVRSRWDGWQARLAARLEPGPIAMVTRVIAVLPLTGPSS